MFAYVTTSQASGKEPPSCGRGSGWETSWSVGGSVVEFLPAAQEARVPFLLKAA